MKQLHTGCCGWAVRGGQEAYFRAFDTIELQTTFYKLPRVETAGKWRERAPRNFVFNMKAWQVVTHPATSPTWRRSGITIQKSKQARYGHLRPTKENFEAWGRTLDVAKALEATLIVIQTPSSFGYTEQNAMNVDKFMSEASTGDFILGWEPRGTWRNHPEEVRRLCERHGITHIVDPFRWRPIARHPVMYLRLHGIGRSEVNYGYRYTEDDLERLSDIVASEMKDRREGYVMFNNISMAEDASRFKHILEARFR